MNPEINTSVMSDDIRLQVSNCNGDDFLRRTVSLRASQSGSGHEVIWNIPDRLVTSSAWPVIFQELLAEFQERFPA